MGPVFALTDGIKAKMRKILALAERGCGGEKLNAQAMLDRMLAANGMKIEDILDEEKRIRWFAYRTREEKEVLFHLAARCIDPSKDAIEFYRGKRGRIGFEVTQVQFLEMASRHKTLLRTLRRERKRFIIAFIMKQDLASPGKGQGQQYTDEELEAIWAYARGIQRVGIRLLPVGRDAVTA